VCARDAAGNLDSTPAEWRWTLDTVPPETSIDAHPPPRDFRDSAVLHFASESTATFDGSLDGAAFSRCEADVTLALAERSHALQVRATDAAGNVDPTPAEFTWDVAFLRFEGGGLGCDSLCVLVLLSKRRGRKPASA
jgi:hypothetical protein